MIPFSYYIDKFLNYLAIEKNYSEHTLTNYRVDLREFAGFLDRQKTKDIQSIDYFLLRKFFSGNGAHHFPLRRFFYDNRSFSTVKMN